jgi:hypothetical protein
MNDLRERERSLFVRLFVILTPEILRFARDDIGLGGADYGLDVDDEAV